MDFINTLHTLDILAAIWLAVGWVGYTYFADRRVRRGSNLMDAMYEHRLHWMQRMLERDARVVDSTLIGIITRSVSLFASTTIFILAGLMAVLGAVDKARSVVSELPFVMQTTQGVWELKVLVMLIIFVYAFFKFAWSLRQFNYAVVFVGAAPLAVIGEKPTSEGLDLAVRAAQVLSLAVSSFNRGIRAYYFGLATLSWFWHPVVFLLCVMWVVAVLYRREFRSQTLAALCGSAARY